MMIKRLAAACLFAAPASLVRAEPVSGLQAAFESLRPAAVALGKALRVPALGEAAPDFALPSARDGKIFRLRDARGKVVLLDFWASWCPPCRASTPALAALRRQYKDRGFEVVGVNRQEDATTIWAFEEEMKEQMSASGLTLDNPVVMDADAAVFRRYGGIGIPTFVLIGRDGTIRGRWSGFSPEKLDAMRVEIEKALAK